MKMSQQSSRTMLEKAGQKSGGTGGRRAEKDTIERGSKRKATANQCVCVCGTDSNVTFIASLLSPPLLLRLLGLRVVQGYSEGS